MIRKYQFSVLRGVRPTDSVSLHRMDSRTVRLNSSVWIHYCSSYRDHDWRKWKIFTKNAAARLILRPRRRSRLSFCLRETFGKQWRGAILFHETYLTPDDIAYTQDSIQKRVLRYFGKRKFFDKEMIEKMLSYENSGFSLNANIWIPSWDREGLERLIRYCARPCFASENLRWNGPWINYRFPKPARDGKRFIRIEPLELIDRISKFIPYPRPHRRHYHGIFAPNSPLRKKIAIKETRINPTAFWLKKLIIAKEL